MDQYNGAVANTSLLIADLLAVDFSSTGQLNRYPVAMVFTRLGLSQFYNKSILLLARVIHNYILKA